MKIDLVDRETGRPVDRETGWRSESARFPWFPGFQVYRVTAHDFRPYRRGQASRWTAMKIDSVGRETGRPGDRVGERIGPVSLVSWFTGLRGYVVSLFHRYRRAAARGVCFAGQRSHYPDNDLSLKDMHYDY
ncbi:MAG TPA: hypothetical protein ENK60_08545 [Anaerolineae bacterium]|nr:hypothetical protein [Anaerolineae bacterium]